MVSIFKKVISGGRVSSEEDNQTFKGTQGHQLHRKIEIPDITLVVREKAERRPD